MKLIIIIFDILIFRCVMPTHQRGHGSFAASIIYSTPPVQL